MNAQEIIEILNNSHLDDTTNETPATLCKGGKPVENDGNGWITITGTLYPTFDSIPWQAQGGAVPATADNHA